MKRSDETAAITAREAEAARHLAQLREFRDAGERLADGFARSGLHVKAATLRGALVILANQTVEDRLLAIPGYRAAIVALDAIVDGRLPKFYVG